MKSIAALGLGIMFLGIAIMYLVMGEFITSIIYCVTALIYFLIIFENNFGDIKNYLYLCPMSKSIKSEEAFDKVYQTQTNHIIRAVTASSVADEDICSFGGKMYETYGDEVRYVIEMAKENRVVTIIECGNDMYYSSGYHLVNRLGYLITDKPIEGEFNFKLKW